MNIELYVAYIAACTSVLVAVVGLITSIITKRQATRSEKLIETLRHELSQKETTVALTDKHLSEALTSLQLAITAIQSVKDEIQLILASIETSLDSDTAIKRITSARERLFACFESELANLNKKEDGAFHKAKNHSLIIENFIRKVLNDKPYTSQLSKEEKRHLLDLRNDLTDLQQILRDSRAGRLIERIRREQ